MIVDLIKSMGFWDWYLLVMMINIGFFAFLTWMEGQLTIKEACLFIALVFIPILNVIALVLIIIGGFIAAAESEEDPVIWRRKKVKVAE